MANLFSSNPYYHETTKKLVSAVGEIFSNIRITKKDSSGNKDQVIEVPIEYSAKNKWMSLLKEDPQKQKNVEITLPRIAFEIVGYEYDVSRKVGTAGSYVVGRLGQNSAKIFNPVPYNISFNVYSLCKTQEDSLQILEQILPYFSPSMTISLEVLSEFKLKKDVPIILRGVEVDDSYQGLATDFRLVTQVFSFVAKLDYFGPINSSGKIIKKTIVELNAQENSQQSLTNTQTVEPFTANKTDPHTILETWGLE